MPGMPIFQDSPSQLKSQIYVWDSDAEEIAALTVDAGHLPVTGSVGLTAGTEVGLASGAEVALVSATTVGLAAGSNLIGKVENQPVFTNVDAFGAGAILTPYSVGSAATVEADAQDISLENSYNWFIKNTGDTPVIQTITLVVEIRRCAIELTPMAAAAHRQASAGNSLYTVLLSSAAFLIVSPLAYTDRRAATGPHLSKHLSPLEKIHCPLCGLFETE